MAKTITRAAEQMYDQLFSTRTRRKKYPGLQAYLSKGGSIFPLVEMGEHGLVKDYRMSPADAKAFLRQASSMAIYIRRQFIEHTLNGGEQGETGKALKKGPSSGMLSMVDGPSYAKLFKTDFDTLCLPDDLRGWWSPVAYLVDLLQWISERIEPYGDATKLPLHDRRKDLKKLVVDFNAVYQSISSVDIIIKVLETFAGYGPDQDLVDALLDARYPNDLPYYQHWVTVDAIAQHLSMSVGNFAHTVDPHFPYFLQANAWDADAGRALAHASRMGPYQRTLLTEAGADFTARKVFFEKNFGFNDADEDKYPTFKLVKFFGERAALEAAGVEALLSIRAFAPVRSPYVTYTDEPPADPESERSGSVYINAGTAPPIRITEDSGALQTLNLDPDKEADFKRCDRINRKVRLDKSLGLRSHEVDAVLVAAIRAEVRGGAKDGDWWITKNVTHALGLFQLMHERYGCTALDFAAFIDEMSVYGHGEELSLFDQVFNRHGNYRQPLNLDGGDFPVMPVAGSTDLTVNQLCSGLNIDLLTYGYLALVIAQAHGLGDKLKRNTAIVSSFYRLVKLSRQLGITPAEGVLMLGLLGGEAWLKGLAGVPQINTTAGGPPDVLNLICALHSCVGWCKDRDLPVLWMLEQVAEPRANGTASEAQLQLFEKVRNLLPAALLTNSGFLVAGVSPLPAGNWLNLLSELADVDGLVLAFSGTEAGYLNYARRQLDLAVRDGLPDMDGTSRAAIVEKMLGVLLQARDAQISVAKEALAVYTSLDGERALWVLAWTDTSVYQLLCSMFEGTSPDTATVRRAHGVEPDPLLQVLADVQRRSAVVKTLELSADLLQDFLEYGYKAWLDQVSPYTFSMGTLYYLTTLTRAFGMSEQPAQVLLDYLRDVSKLPTLTGDALDLAQKAAAIRLAGFFSWSVQEVRECISHIDSSPINILTNLRQLDLLMRIRTLSEHSGMNARTIFLIGNLSEATDKAAYSDAAEHALLSQSETPAPVLQPPGEVEQLVVMTCTVVDNNYAVANKPEEKITFKVTLTDAKDVPLKGVNVYWQTRLGSVATQATQIDGTLEAIFYPGTVLGTETPRFWLDLFEPVNAPEINIVPDPDTLSFPPALKSPVPLGTVRSGEEVQLYAVLRDEFKNLGPNQLVDWYSEPSAGIVIRPMRQTFTDPQGLTKVFVSATKGGEFVIFVRSQSSDISTYFDLITFEPSV
ncbi:Tc toxin subunit A [Pseudomonas sp. LB3P14]